MENLFLKQYGKENTFTENGAISNSSTGDVFVDEFSKAAMYRGRDYSEVSKDQSLLWDTNKIMSMRFIFYLRQITRKDIINSEYATKLIQNGQGVKDEVFKRLIWVAENHNDVFNKNIWLLPIVGSWKDLWVLLYYDKILETHVIDRNVIFELIKQGISIQEHCELIKKFMPRIKSKGKIKTNWLAITNELAYDFARYMHWSPKEYNKFKSSGTAHNFQKIICSKEYDKINWNLIPGKALSNLVKSNFLGRHNLVESYTKWIDSQPLAKYTGYVYELGKQFLHNNNIPVYKKHTLNKQFLSLIEKAKDNGKIKGNVWCALDTSYSMTSLVDGKVSALDVCKSLGVFFSTLNEGAFHKSIIMFDSTSRIKRLSGDFCDMLSQIPDDAMGGTNFMSVIDEIVRVRKNNPEIPLSDYPSTLLIVSDMQFNVPSSANLSKDTTLMTNYQAMKEILYTCFPKDFVDSMKFIWWNVNSHLSDFPSRFDDGGTYLFSGFDGSVISMLLGGETKNSKQLSMTEMVDKALNQEILLQVVV